MTLPKLLQELQVLFGKAGLMLAVLIFSANSFAQRAAPNCPPPQAEPTAEKIQKLFRQATDRGFLWKIEKGEKSGYLYGSLHVGRQAWSVPGPKTLAAITGSAVIALELDILDPAVQAQIADPARFGIKSFDLPQVLKNRMQAAAKRACAPSLEVKALHPVMQLITVTLYDARFSGLDIGYGSEVFIAGFARRSQKPVESLETVELQLRALLDGEPGELTEAIARSLTLLENGKGRAVNDRMANAWATGNLSDLQEYQKWCGCVETEADRTALRRLNDDRNPRLAEGIDWLMRNGQPVFAAVGALHMTGPKALPKLLQEMGYKVERVTFD